MGSEDANRARKAQAYADCLAAQGATAADVAQLPDRGWELVKQLCGWPTLPSATTKRLVVDILADREARAVPPLPADPWDAFPHRGRP